jgi:hypothetical protein
VTLSSQRKISKPQNLQNVEISKTSESQNRRSNMRSKRGPLGGPTGGPIGGHIGGPIGGPIGVQTGGPRGDISEAENLKY